MPFHQIEGRDGIFYRGVTDVGPTGLNGPSEVLFDPTESESDHTPTKGGKGHTNLAAPVCMAVQPDAETQ